MLSSLDEFILVSNLSTDTSFNAHVFVLPACGQFSVLIDSNVTICAMIEKVLNQKNKEMVFLSLERINLTKI